MTGQNFERCADFQTAFWPSEWQYAQQHLFGGIDAPDWLPAGGMRQQESEYACYGVTLAASRSAS